MVLSAADATIAERIKESPEAKIDFSRYIPDFTEEAVRGGTVVQGKYEKLVLTPEDLSRPTYKELREKVIGEIGGNVTVDFHVLPNIDKRGVELIRAVMGAEQELTPKDPEYSAYFQSVSDYGNKNPMEDFAEVFSEYLMKLVSLSTFNESRIVKFMA